ncbi:MAG TPA: ferric reductase-like transmembrane domain-containing protein [Candidatus Saccharimonas sp.]|nr:ferric reductase-like transmembrane domain-containing protein [Candidatus Saccharimonas sp.]
MSRSVKKWLAWGLWAVNLAIIIWFWVTGNARIELASGDLVAVWHAFARLFGLLATFCALTQFVLMGRAGWLEPIFGMDRLAIFHRRNGIATILLILAHSISIVITHALLTGRGLAGGVELTFGLPYIWWAAIAEALFIITVGTSIFIVRKHLKFEWWYTVHWCNYAAIVIVPFHQLANGDDLVSNPIFRYYWISIYVFAALNMIIWRFGRTIWLYWRHEFKVEKVIQETPNATSVYFTGKNLQTFTAKAGQFILVRFFDKQRVWQEHPFSLSMLPNKDHFRITVRQLGDFTNAVPTIKPGTPVWVSGPFGAFTHELQTKQKVLYIAGGIGITPIRSMIEERAHRAQNNTAILLYGNRTQQDTALMGELTSLAAKITMPMYNVLSDQKGYAGEVGFIDKQKIERLVPDIAQRDIFLCGPPPMMTGIKKVLAELGVPASQVHYERFALDKK